MPAAPGGWRIRPQALAATRASAPVSESALRVSGTPWAPSGVGVGVGGGAGAAAAGAGVGAVNGRGAAVGALGARFGVGGGTVPV